MEEFARHIEKVREETEAALKKSHETMQRNYNRKRKKDGVMNQNIYISLLLF